MDVAFNKHHSSIVHLSRKIPNPLPLSGGRNLWMALMTYDKQAWETNVIEI